MKVVSCGVIIIDKKTQKILACHPSMKRYAKYCYDICKGHVEGKETHVQTALRELEEESGIRLKPEDLFDCGLFMYTKYKDLHLYVAECDVELSKLVCSTYFSFEGRRPLEVDDYMLIDKNQTDYYYRSLGPLVDTCLKRYKDFHDMAHK